MTFEPVTDRPDTGAADLKIPQHLGVIMDGNGRWAKARGLPRTDGHRAGVRALRKLVDLCVRYSIAHLTVFSFSSENWSRPRDEISFIFGLLHRYVASDLAKLIRNNVRIRILGSRDDLDASLRRLLDKVETDTAHNTGLNLMVAFNYGGKAEIVCAAQKLAAEAAAGTLDPADIDEEMISGALLTKGVPDPDLIIRTSGEQRLSNFLLWQSAYAELVFPDAYWPDFNEDVFLRALRDYGARDRRFGGVEASSL